MNFDYIILGGGLSGLLLAYFLNQETVLREKQILIVDRREHCDTQKTFAYWSKEAGPFDFLADREWHRFQISARGKNLPVDLGMYRYRVIGGQRFFDYICKDLEKNPNITRACGVVTDIETDGEECLVHLDDRMFRGRYLFNSTEKTLHKKPRKKAGLYMQFKGQIIETEEDVFNPDLPHFLDFRTIQRERTRFFYMLPYSARKALVEYTSFCPPVDLKKNCESPIKEYLDKILGIRKYRVTYDEGTIIPLRIKKTNRCQTKRIVDIGIQGGLLKPSTGYGFTRIIDDSRRIARNLAAHGDPHPVKASPALFTFADSIMMRVMLRFGEHIQGIFLKLFERNPVHRVLRFLDEKAGILECLSIMKSLPSRYFADALVFRKKKPYIGKEAEADLEF